MTQVYSGPGRVKYATEEEARLANIEKTKQRYKQNREQKIEQQREYQEKLRVQRKNYEQMSSNPMFPIVEQVMTDPHLYQQFISYINLLNNPPLYQEFVEFSAHTNTANYQRIF